jgi:putative ABC transport system substrate-binding protein
MRRREFIAKLGGAAAAWPVLARAQHAAPVPRIGLLSIASEASDPLLRAAAFREGLRDFGWIEGQTISLDYHYAAGDAERLPALAAEIVAKRVAAIVTFDSDSTRVALAATRTIPIVMAASADPVGSGFTSSLARPGGNVTGVSFMMRDLVPKQLEVLKETVGRLARVGVVHLRTPWHEDMVADLAAAGRALDISIQGVPIDAADDLATRFAAMVATGIEAILVLPHPTLDEMRSRFSELALLHQMPSIGPIRSAAVAGFLFSYGPSVPDMHRLAARYVARIMTGEIPARLPVEQPTQLELVVNLNTAWALGLTVPPSLLARADHVIE